MPLAFQYCGGKEARKGTLPLGVSGINDIGNWLYFTENR
jgi:hypothetical protein